MVIVSKITEKEVLETIETLEIRVDEFIQKCGQLNIENQSLKEKIISSPKPINPF